MPTPRSLTKRRPGGRLGLVVTVGLLVVGLLGVVVIIRGGGSPASASARSLRRSAVAGRSPAPGHPASAKPAAVRAAAAKPAVVKPALARRRDASSVVAHHPPAPRGSTRAATVADGLVPTPVHPPAGWAVSAHHLASGGLDRYYLVARPTIATTVSATVTAADGPAGAPSSVQGPTPSKPAKSLPVLVVLHGRMMTPAAMMGMSHFLTEVGPAIVVYPSGYDESWDAGYCCGGANRAGVNDVAFLSAVVHQVLAEQPGADAGQVYLAGYSNGGRMAYRMACDVPGMFAGVAAVEAVSVSSCASSDPVPLLIVASQDDPVVSIGLHAPPKHIEGRAEITVQAEVAQWRALEGCRPGTTEATLGDLKTQTWARCAGDGRIEEAVYGGGSHAWFDACRSTPSAQALIWAFFHDGAPTVEASGEPACPLHLSPTPGVAPAAPGRTVIK